MATSSGKSVASRLFIQPGHKVGLINAPENGAKLLGRLPAGAQIVGGKKASPADRVILFVTAKKELENLLPAAIEATESDGTIWVAYPKLETKLSDDVSRQVVHDSLRLAGWKPIGVISIDDVWTAIRARPATQAERRKI